MKLAWSFVTKWQNSAVSIEPVVNPGQLFNISGNPMRLAQLCSAGYNSWKFTKCAN
jgi:hypothetical protein